MLVLGPKGLIWTPHYYREFALPLGRESPYMRAWSAVSRLAQAQSALLASPPCDQYNTFLAATLFI